MTLIAFSLRISIEIADFPLMAIGASSDVTLEGLAVKMQCSK